MRAVTLSLLLSTVKFAVCSVGTKATCIIRVVDVDHV